MTEIGFGKLGKMGSLDLSRLKSGVKKTDLQNDVQKSIFDKVDKNGNGVLEEGEVNALSQSLQELAGKDNNISDKEAQNFFKQNKMQDVESQQLYEFVSQLGVDSDKIDNASKQTMKDGTEAVAVQYKPDDTGTTNTDFMNSDTGEVVAKKSENEQTEVFTEYENGNVKTKTTTDKAANTTTTENFIEGGGGLPSSKTTVYGDSGATETIKYEGGKPATKEINRGTVQQLYSTDENGEFRLDSETKQIGPEMEEKSTHTYINNNEIIETTLPGNKTRTQVKTDGKLMSETNTQTGRSETVTYDKNGKPTSKTILKGSDFDNPDVKNQIRYNKDGSRTESFEQPAKGIQITDHYNDKGFKTKETAVVKGKTYTATYDGKGHGTLTMKAGETVESFAQRTGCPVSEINRLNKFPGGVPQAGQQIKVPEKYVKATDSNNFAVNRNTERAKGNAAEEQRVENTMGKLSNVYEQKNTKGKYQSYDDYTSRLIQNEVKNGTLPESALNDKNLHKELSQKIKNLNGGADIKSLDSIKCPVSSSYNTKLKNVEKQQTVKFNATNITAVLMNETLNAENALNEHKENSTLFEEGADQFGRMNLFGDNNYSGDVRDDINTLKRGLGKMNACLKKNDMAGFKKEFKNTYGIEYNEANIQKYYKNPTDANRATAFGKNPRISNIVKRTETYVQSDKDGATVIKAGVAITVGIATGGAGGVVAGAALGAGMEYGERASKGVVNDLRNGKGVDNAAEHAFNNVKNMEAKEHVKILAEATVNATVGKFIPKGVSNTLGKVGSNKIVQGAANYVEKGLGNKVGGMVNKGVETLAQKAGESTVDVIIDRTIDTNISIVEGLSNNTAITNGTQKLAKGMQRNNVDNVVDGVVDGAKGAFETVKTEYGNFFNLGETTEKIGNKLENDAVKSTAKSTTKGSFKLAKSAAKSLFRKRT